MIVMKFGGSSVQDALSMEKVLDIVNGSRHKNVLVVFSACYGVTDKLIAIAKMAGSRNMEGALREVSLLEDRHRKIAQELLKNEELRQTAFKRIGELFGELRILAEGISLLAECTPKSLDACSAYGELLSTSLFSFALQERTIKSAFIDARTVILTDSSYNSASVNFEKTAIRSSGQILPLLKTTDVIITQGFIGSAPDGSTTTLGRGGSDYSAAVFGAALEAEEIQIWTDVNGILSTDPRLIPEAVTIPEISFDEVRELSFYGAKVLHPDTIKPAVSRSIPVRVLNTMEPEKKGTLILESVNNHKDKVRSLVLKENCIYFKFMIPASENSLAFLSGIIDILKTKNIKVLTVSMSENNCIMVIEQNDSTPDSISSLYDKYKLTRQEASLLCLCGSGISGKGSRALARLRGLSAILGEFNPISVLYGVSETSILVVLNREAGLQALKAAHSHFIFP